MSDTAPTYAGALYEAPLVIRRSTEGTPSVKLAGLELAMLLAKDGIDIRYDADEFGGWIVSLTFGPGSLDLDFDVDLLQQLLEAKRDPDAPRKLGDPA